MLALMTACVSSLIRVSDIHNFILILLCGIPIGFIFTGDIDVNWMSFEGQTALHLACEEGHLSCIQLLLEHGANMNLRDVLQQTPLFICMRDRNVAACRALIEAGADVNCQRFGGSTPLHLAATAGSSEMVQLLLASGAELNAKEEFGITPIFAAAQFGHLSCLKLFVREAKHRGGFACGGTTLLGRTSPRSNFLFLVYFKTNLFE